MANKNYLLAVSSVKIGSVKTILYSGTYRSFHLYFPRFKSNVGKLRYKRPAHNVTQHV